MKALYSSVLLYLALFGCKKETPLPPGPSKSLVIFCGAGIRAAMEPLKASFEKENKVIVKVNYAGSGVLLGKLQAGVPADLFLPGDIFYVDKAEELGYVARSSVVAWFVPVIGVPKGNPKAIKKLEDLARPDVRVGLGRAEACAVGRVAQEILKEKNLLSKVKPHYESMTVNDLANQLKLKALDAAIIWDATARQYGEDLEVVDLEDPFFYAVPLPMAVLKKAQAPDLADAFLKFATSEKRAKYFRENYYRVPGKTLRIASGSSFRPVVEELAKRFEETTGCKTLRDYGGSGVVLLQIEESKEGDIYICHDPFAYVCEDKGIAEKWYTIAYIHPVLAVKKGNPKKVKGLKDLLRDDLRLGLPHREYSTRGKILWTILEKAGFAEAIRKRKFYESRTHDLINQLKLGTVDVAVLWDAPTKEMPDLDAVPIEEKYKVDSITSPTSGRTYSLEHVKVTLVRLKFSKEPLLAAQFARFCLSEEGRKILAKHCFVLPPK